MNLDFSETQEMLRTSARDFLSKECPKTKVKELEDSETGHDSDLWNKTAGMGWLGLTLPEEYGGSAMEFIDLVILMEEIGRNVLPGPFFSTVCLCSEPILQYGTEEQKKEYLPKIADGSMICALAINEESASFHAVEVELNAKPEGSDYVLNGTKLFVNDANVADCLLVVARTTEQGAAPEEGVTLFLVDAKSAGISTEVLQVTSFDKQCRVTFNNVKVPASSMLGEKDKGWPVVEAILQRAAVLRSAEMLGGCEALTEMTSAYAKERVQYEHPLADFQVVQHNIVNMWISTETMRNIVYYAASRLGEGMPCAKEVSACKAWCTESMKFVAERSVQMHGGIGTTRDHDAGLYYRRAWAWDHLFGNASYHREIVAKELLA